MSKKLNEYGEEIPNPIINKSKLTVEIDRDLFKRFKIKCLMNNETITEVVKRFIIQYLEEK